MGSTGPPKGLGGTLAPFSAGGGALPAGLGLPEATGFTLAGADGVLGATTLGETGAGSTTATAAGGSGGATAAAALALGAVAAARGGSSVAPMMIAPTVPMSTHTPRTARPTRRPRPALVRSSEYEPADDVPEDGRAAGTAAGVKT